MTSSHQKPVKSGKSIIQILNSLAKISSENLVKQLQTGLLKENAPFLLDFGCGSGIYLAT